MQNPHRTGKDSGFICANMELQLLLDHKHNLQPQPGLSQGMDAPRHNPSFTLWVFPQLRRSF